MYLLNPYWYTRQYSAPVSNYLDQVIAADVAAGNLLGLEDGTKTGYATFIDNLIVDGYLGVTGGTINQASSVIKASPIMAGARTLNGALIPLVGTAPTNFNFVSDDYNRKTGLWPGATNTTKYLNSNRNNNADPQNNQHLSCHVTAIGLSVAITTLTSNSVSGVSHIGLLNVRSRNVTPLGSGMATGFNGISRSTSASFVQHVGGASTTLTQASETPVNDSIAILRSGVFYGTHRLAFYSIGESLDLALLDARITALINTFGAAIP